MPSNIKHPAKYTDIILENISKYIPQGARVLDPFAGTGKLKEIIHSNLYLNEIEFEWAIQGKPANVAVGDALCLPYKDDCFDVICTSPAYGNRMADGLRTNNGNWKKDWHYITYEQYLGKKSHQNNAGHMHWGVKYQEFHKYAWNECNRVLKQNGTFIVNISNHIRGGKEMFVSEWHLEFLTSELGLVLLEHIKVNTPRNKFGQNGKARVDHENIFILRKPLTE